MTIKERAKEISALLVARRFIARTELRDMFLDEELLAEVEKNLQMIGLDLATNVYSKYVSLKVARDMESSIFDDGKGGYISSNYLKKGDIALLAIIWAKIILPKRQMQIERKPADDVQASLLPESKPIPRDDELISIDEKALFADFGEKFGGKTMFSRYLSNLSRADLIKRKNGTVYEGPLLDTIIDYSLLAPRIINGTLGEILGLEKESSEMDDLDIENEAAEDKG